MPAVLKAVSNVLGAVGDVVGGVVDVVSDVGGAVVDAVGDVVDFAVDVVEDVVGTVADVVVDAAEWVYEEVVEPVVEGVVDVVNYALDNPIEAIATLAVTIAAPYAAPFLGTTTAALTSAANWVIPLASGTNTLVKGGDLGDAVKSAAVSFAGSYASNAVSTYVTPTVTATTTAALGNTQLATTVSSALNVGTKSGVKTFVATGGDTKAALNAFTSAATLGGVKGGLEAATDAVMGGIEQSFLDSDLGKSINDLSDGVKESIYVGVAAELTGQDLSANEIIAALDSEGFVSDIVNKYVPLADFMDGLVTDAKESLGKNLSETQIKILSDAVGASWDAAKAGNPNLSGDEFFASLQGPAYEELIDTISDPIDSALDSLTGNSAKAEAAAKPLNDAIGKATEATTAYNALSAELNERVQEQERLRGEYNATVDAYNANPSQATADAANIASAAFNNYANDLNKDYEGIKAELDGYEATYNEYEPIINGLQATYDEESQYLLSDVEDLDNALKPMLSGVERVIATTLRPGIDEDKYRELNGLEAGEDVYAHYLGNIGIAQVFDVEQLNAEAKAENAELYGEGYTHGYDEAGMSTYYIDTPDGKKKVDPYLEGVGGGRGGDPRDFANGVWTMEQYRKKADPIELGGRFTYDMAVIAGDASKQGQIITLNDFHKLKDAGYTIMPFKDKLTGETINGSKSYEDVLANFMQERARADYSYTKPTQGYAPINFMGYTETTEDIHNDVIGYWKSTGMSDADAIARAAETAPVGEMLDGAKFSENSSLTDLAGFRDYLDTLETPDGEEDKYAFNENYEQNMIAEATRLGENDAIDDFLSNSAGLSLDAIGQLAQTFSYATILTNKMGITDTAAQDTWLNKFGEALSETGKGIQTDEYKAKVKKLNEDMAAAMEEAEGVGGTFKAVLGVAWENPGAFVSEYIVSEIIQELPLLLATGGTATLIRGGASVTAKAVGMEFAESTLKRAGVYSAVGTAGVTNVAEAFGGAAQDGYEKGLETYNRIEFENLRKQGLSVGEARAALQTSTHIEKSEKFATELAEQAGIVGAGIALVTAGIGSKIGLADNLALEKALFGAEGKAPKGFIDQLVNYATTIGKEGVAEGLEEGGAAAFVEGRLSLIDPTRDVSGNITMAALLGTMSSAGTTGGILVGNEIVSGLNGKAAAFVTTSSPETLQKLGMGNFQGSTYDEAGISGAGTVSKPTETEIETTLAEVGITDTDTLLTFKDYNYDSEFTTKEEVKEFVTLSNPTFEFTDEIATGAYEELVGKKDDTKLQELVDKYIDPFFTTPEEAIAAATAEGVTLTEEQITEIIEDGNVTEEEVTEEINEQFDDTHTSEEEATEYFNELGYTPTDEEIANLVGKNTTDEDGVVLTDEEQQVVVEEYVDPRLVTEEEVVEFFEDQGYTPTEEEIATYVGQGDEAFQDTAVSDLETYVDPRQVTDEEARKFFTDLGYNPTDEQVAQFVAQVAETEQSSLISQYVDPRQVTRDELQNIADEEGLTLTDALAAAYVGQGEAETFATETLDTARTEYDPLATTLDEATQFFADTNYTATAEEIAQFVASKTEEVQNSAIGAYVDPRQMTAAEAETFLSEIGYQPTQEEIDQFTGQVNDDSYQITQQTAIGEYVDPRYVDAGEVRAAYEELGLVDVNQEDVDRFVGQFDETTQLEAVSDYLPTATFNVIKQIVGSPSVADNPDTDVDESKDATGLFASLEDGKSRDEALQTAIDGVASDLDITKDELLAEINLTESQLSDEIDVVVGDVSDLTGDVSDLTGDVEAVTEDVGELADVIGTAGVEDNPDTEVDETQDPTGLYATIKAYEDAGIARDDAIQQAVDDVSTALGTTKTDLLDAIGETESTLSDEIGDVETALTEEIGDVETALTEEIGSVEQTLGADIDVVADLVGKPAREVTQTDVDFVIDLIAQENVSQELTTQYDVNGDGIVDITDQTMLETAVQGDVDTDTTTDTNTFADTSIFGPATGLYAEQEQDTQTTLDAITDMNTEINTKIDTNTQQQNLRDFLEMGQQGMFRGARMSTTPAPLANIDYLYDFNTIFANPSQESKFLSPYSTTTRNKAANTPAGPMAAASGFAQGGQVEDETDMLLRMIKDM